MGVPLLSRPTFIRRQDPVDDPGKPIPLRTRRRSAPPVSGWDRKRQHLGYCPRVNAKLPRRFVEVRGEGAHLIFERREGADVVDAALLVKRRHRFSSNYLAA
jgi:hypothetical protein